MANLEKKRSDLKKQLMACTNMIKGSISSVCGGCNRANCICKNQDKAKVLHLTYKDKSQKTRTVYVPKAKLKEVKKLINNFKRCKIIIDQLIDLNIAIFKEKL
jgi:hypothetical protein